MTIRLAITCNRNYILFTKLPWPGDSKGTFRSSSQAATCPPVYHTRRRLHTVPFNAERQAGKLWIPIFIVFGLTRPGIEPESIVSVADALFSRPLIDSRPLLDHMWKNNAICLVTSNKGMPFRMTIYFRQRMGTLAGPQSIGQYSSNKTAKLID